MDAETVQVTDWWASSRNETQAAWIANYQQSLKSRQRTRLTEILKQLQPETLLEVGCHCGPNLVRFAKELPGLSMIGLDANTDAIEAGRVWVKGLGLSDRIQLNVGRFPGHTAALASHSFDVVLTCYTCAYIAPADLDAALYELGRLASRAVVLAEPMGAFQWRNGHAGYLEWTHDYEQAWPWINSWRGMTTRVVAVDPPIDNLRQILVAERA